MKKRPRLQLPPKTSTVGMGPDDPLPQYYKPIIGQFFRRRIELGLYCLPDQSDRILEVGYGGGLLLPTLSQHCRELYGVDRHDRNVAIQDALQARGVSAKLVSADAKQLPFPDAHFDVVISFSMLEHVKPVGAFIDEMVRVIKPGGRIIIGMPMVNRWFNQLFILACQFDVKDHHITTPADVRRNLRQRTHLNVRETGMPPWLPALFRIYSIFEISRQ